MLPRNSMLALRSLSLTLLAFLLAAPSPVSATSSKLSAWFRVGKWIVIAFAALTGLVLLIVIVVILCVCGCTGSSRRSVSDVEAGRQTRAVPVVPGAVLPEVQKEGGQSALEGPLSPLSQKDLDAQPDAKESRG